MYKTVFLEEKVPLSPNDISTKEKAESIDVLLLERLKSKIEAKCISSGYVKPDSLEILHRSMGAAENGRFTGNYLFFVKLRCKVFHPEAGTPIECRVLKVNKMGAYAVFDEAMRVLLPRDLHIGNVEFDKLNPNDVVSVQVLRSRFQTNDPFISSVGMFQSRIKIGKPDEKKAGRAAPAKEEEEAAEASLAEGSEGDEEEEE
jgi:DNA-directed RNA polymerase subunit E'/Rpb7